MDNYRFDPFYQINGLFNGFQALSGTAVDEISPW